MKQRGPHGDRTHCPHGHPYSGDNLILMVVRDEDGKDTGRRKRQCRECKRNSQRNPKHAYPVNAHKR